MPVAQHSPDEIKRRITALGPWFHNMRLAGVQTAPEHPLGDYPALKWKRFSNALMSEMKGRSVLDIGCNGGFYAIEAHKAGAARVVAIDEDADYLRQAEFAADVSEAREIEFRQLSVYDVASLEEKFDIVLFMGVLYHLRHPLLALDLIYQHVVKDVLVFQSMLRGTDEISTTREDYPFSAKEHFNEPGYPKLHFVEMSYAGDPTNWWIPNKACAEAMLRSAGFAIECNPENEVYFCRKAGATLR